MRFPRSFAPPLALLAFSAAMAILSPGFFEADEITHYLKARAIFHDWRAVLDIWGRPACTGLFGLASAVGGLTAAHLLAVALTALTAAGTVQLWKSLPLQTPPTSRLDPVIFLTLLLYAQPLFLMNTFAVMTELLLACSWIWAAVLLARHKPLLASLVLGLGGLARPEGWFAIAAWPIILLLWRKCSSETPSTPGEPSQLPVTNYQLPAIHRPASIPHLLLAASTALLPLLAWYLLGLLAYHNPLWPRDQFPWQATSQYGTTGLFFLGSALISLALWMWFPIALALRGVAPRLATPQRGVLPPKHGILPASPFTLLVTAPFLAFYALHAFLGIFGLMGSMSLPRYFVAVAPFAAILTLRGLQQLESRTRRPRLFHKALLTLILLPLATLIAFCQLPTSKTTDMLRLDVATSALRARLPAARGGWPTQLIAGHPYIFYSLGISLDTPAHLRVFDRAAIAAAPPGTMLITDSKIWLYEHRPTPGELRAMGYREDPAVARAIDAVPAKLDLSTLGRITNPVRLWIKQPVPPAAASASSPSDF